MPYPRKFLNDYETVALDLHPHWWFFAHTVIVIIGGVIVGLLSLTLLDNTPAKTVNWLAIIMILGGLVWTATRYIKWRNTNFVITSDRIIFKSGVVAKAGTEIPLERVNNVIFRQSIFERVLGLGDLMIESGGEDGQTRFTDIKHPEKVQNLIHSQMELNESRRFQHPNDRTGGNDVASQLERLEGLMERGSLTRAEFDAQKQRILDK